MAGRVTIQDIADALGLSRNTVSKAINNTGVIADATRDNILKKAAEMGYKQFSYFSPASMPAVRKNEVGTKNEISLFTTGRLDSSHFASTMLDKLQQQFSEAGYGLAIYRLLLDDIKELRLPVHFNTSRSAGIICTELFDLPYCRMLTELSMPLLFVDSPFVFDQKPLAADILLMDNTTSIYSFVGEMHSRGIRRIGFVGEPKHCRSFYERYCACRTACSIFEIDNDPSFNVNYVSKFPGTYTDDDIFLDFMRKRLSEMDPLPEVLICANDFVAIDTIRTCNDMGIRVPEDIMICGFDDSSESRIFSPSLTSIHIHSQSMGGAAVGIMLSRINEPQADFTTMYVATDLIYRESTGD